MSSVAVSATDKLVNATPPFPLTGSEPSGAVAPLVRTATVVPLSVSVTVPVKALFTQIPPSITDLPLLITVVPVVRRVYEYFVFAAIFQIY